jgi:hypothetical protein
LLKSLILNRTDQIPNAITGKLAKRQSQPYESIPIITPASTPPPAPIKFITKSLAPWDAGRIEISTLSDKSAEPAIKVHDQPKPNRNNPNPNFTDSIPLEVPATTVAAKRRTTPT